MHREGSLGEIPRTKWRSRALARRNASQLCQKGQLRLLFIFHGLDHSDRLDRFQIAIVAPLTICLCTHFSSIINLPSSKSACCAFANARPATEFHFPFTQWVRGRGDRVRGSKSFGSTPDQVVLYSFQNKLMCAENEYRLPLHLMCSTTLLIVDKFTIYKVSTSTRAERQPFLNNYNIASEKAIFIDFTSYYYPGKFYSRFHRMLPI